MCGECRYGEGGIFVEEDEIKRIAHFLGITPKAFLSEFCEKKIDAFMSKLARISSASFTTKQSIA
jgi:hypothetical protein